MNIEPCLCENIPNVINNTWVDENGILQDSWNIKCPKCGMCCLIDSPTEEKAVSVWNAGLIDYRKREGTL